MLTATWSNFWLISPLLCFLFQILALLFHIETRSQVIILKVYWEVSANWFSVKINLSVTTKARKSWEEMDGHGLRIEAIQSKFLQRPVFLTPWTLLCHQRTCDMTGVCPSFNYCWKIALPQSREYDKTWYLQLAFDFVLLLFYVSDLIILWYFESRVTRNDRSYQPVGLTSRHINTGFYHHVNDHVYSQKILYIYTILLFGPKFILSDNPWFFASTKLFQLFLGIPSILQPHFLNLKNMELHCPIW